MDIRSIRKLIELLKESSDICEIEIKEGDGSVRISRGTSQQSANYAPPMYYQMPAEAHAPTTNNAAAANAAASSVEEGLKGHVLTSPMVGTVYTAPQPDAAPYVSVGQKVQAGDILCIVEAMKMFNHIEADKTGTITAKLIENGQPVEYGQPLFIIE